MRLVRSGLLQKLRSTGALPISMWWLEQYFEGFGVVQYLTVAFLFGFGFVRYSPVARSRKLAPLFGVILLLFNAGGHAAARGNYSAAYPLLFVVFCLLALMAPAFWKMVRELQQNLVS